MKITRSIRTASIAGALVAGLAVPTVASASYVCSVQYAPHSSAYGDNGYLSVSYYNGGGCNNGYLYTKYYCTENANVSVCSSWANYSEQGLLALYRTLAYAAEVHQNVWSWTGSCLQGGSACGSTVTFTAYP
ncbi:MAG: hypothetical protein K0V04_04260 [Deltaproteobacteria bacterium]|nr:hypothetical protein [Deltaproteobacteria bacterium]